MLVLTIFAVFGTTEAVQQGDNGSRQLGWSLLAVAVLALAGRRLALLGGGALAAVPLVKGVSAPTYPGGRADQTAIGMPTRKPLHWMRGSHRARAGTSSSRRRFAAPGRAGT
jgi:UDP-N-acetylmuramyl pentapeptide phosphotransferase/UDP-N-acetylglucosamine-1-phosphate transferase